MTTSHNRECGTSGAPNRSIIENLGQLSNSLAAVQAKGRDLHLKVYDAIFAKF